MVYKQVRRNGQDVLINTRTGKVVQPGERIANELSWMGKGINDNFTYSDKVDRKTGRRLTPAEVRRAEGKKPPAKPAAKVKDNKAASHTAGYSSAAEVARIMAEGRRKPETSAPKAPAPKPKPQTQATRPAGTQPSRSSTPAAPKKPAAPASSKDRRVSASTANRESGNYGTSRTNNPMIDDAMKARMRQREERDGVGPVKDGARYAADVKSNTKGVGPVKDGTRYASNVKASPTTAGKKKEDETKTMSIAERMRKRRQGLA